MHLTLQLDQSLIRKCLSGSVAVKQLFLNKGNWKNSDRLIQLHCHKDRYRDLSYHNLNNTIQLIERQNNSNDDTNNNIIISTARTNETPKYEINDIFLLCRGLQDTTIRAGDPTRLNQLIRKSGSVIGYIVSRFEESVRLYDALAVVNRSYASKCLYLLSDALPAFDCADVIQQRNVQRTCLLIQLQCSCRGNLIDTMTWWTLRYNTREKTRVKIPVQCVSCLDGFLSRASCLILTLHVCSFTCAHLCSTHPNHLVKDAKGQFNHSEVAQTQ